MLEMCKNPQISNNQGAFGSKPVRALPASSDSLNASKLRVRESWKKQIDKALRSNQTEQLGRDWLDLPLETDSDLEW